MLPDQNVMIGYPDRTVIMADIQSSSLNSRITCFRSLAAKLIQRYLMNTQQARVGVRQQLSDRDQPVTNFSKTELIAPLARNKNSPDRFAIIKRQSIDQRFRHALQLGVRACAP